MRSCSRKAYGKLNLTLDVLGRRSDGYHEMRMLMQTVDLCDDVTVTVETGNPWRCDCAVAPDENNLALKAARGFFDRTGIDPNGLTVAIEKRIPVGGGMAGGSADAAAVLRALNALYDAPLDDGAILSLGASIGSDVPFCLLGGTALAEGRGETLTKLPPMPRCTFVLAKPSFSVSTPALFRALDGFGVAVRPDFGGALEALESGDLAALCGCMANVFEPVLEREHTVIRELREALTAHGALTARLTGTGSVVFGVFAARRDAAAAASALRESGVTAFTAAPV